MSDPNPYQSSQTTEPRRRNPLVKRGLGVGVILLLTPPAIVVAIASSCTAARAVPGYSAAFIPIAAPFLVLTGMMVAAVVLDRPQRGDPNRTRSRAGIFLATPAVVALAAGIGFGLGILVVQSTSVRSGGLNERAMWLALIAFFLLPTLALLAMLIIAWRAGRP
jgi:hypothetical protein